MPARRSPFAQQYGSAKTQQSKGGAKLPPPMTAPSLPLSVQTQAQVPGQGQAPMPAQGLQPMPEQMGQDGSQMQMQLLQRLLAQFGGTHG